MTTEAIAPVQLGAQERALLVGDLKQLSEQQRAELYTSVCRSLGLNPLTRPFDYLILNGKMVLYARKDATDQLRAMHGISITVSKPEAINDILYVTAHATTPTGRTDEDMGAVPINNLRGEALANATLKAITKAKRRVTLSICGLGMLDETEIDAIPGARLVDTTTGEVLPPRRAVASADYTPAPAAIRASGALMATERQRAAILRACTILGMPEPPADWLDNLTVTAAKDWIEEHKADVLAAQERAEQADDDEGSPL